MTARHSQEIFLFPDLKREAAGALNIPSPMVLVRSLGCTFKANGDYDMGTAQRSVVAGDFNGDGKPDIATANCSSNKNISVKFNR